MQKITELKTKCDKDVVTPSPTFSNYVKRILKYVFNAYYNKFYRKYYYIQDNSIR